MLYEIIPFEENELFDALELFYETQDMRKEYSRDAIVSFMYNLQFGGGQQYLKDFMKDNRVTKLELENLGCELLIKYL